MTSKTSDTTGEFLPKQGPPLSLRFLRGWLRRKLPLTPRFQKCHQVRLAFDCCFDVESLKCIEIHRTLPPQELKSWPTIHFLKLSSLSMTWYPDVEVPRDGNCSLWALGENETNSFHTYCSVKIQYATVKIEAKHRTWLHSLNVALMSRNFRTEGWAKSRRRTCHLV